MSEINTSQQKKAQELRDSLAKEFNKDEAKDFASKHKNSGWYDDFITLYDMITSPTYTISTKTKLTIAGTLAYVVLPIDVIPDFLPIVGWLDDAFILAMATRNLSDEIDSYKNSEQERLA